MWLPKLLALTILYVLVVNLLGVAWGWYKRDIFAGWCVAVIGGSGTGVVILAVSFAVWILMGAPTQ